MGFLSAAPTDPEAQYQQNIVALERRIADLERAGGRGLVGAGRNLLDNGAMTVCQRAASLAGINSVNGIRVSDRWYMQLAGGPIWTISNEGTGGPAGTGLTHSQKWLCTTAEASPPAGQYTIHTQSLEGVFLQHLLWGTGSAKSLTASFWVKSNKTGTYIAELVHNPAGSYYSLAYTISAADTWEYKTLTFPGNTATALTDDNNSNLSLYFWLDAGSTYSGGASLNAWGTTANKRAVGQVNLAAAVSNYWQITGVQLEVGSVATAFDTRPYDQELRRCQRYFYRVTSAAYNNQTFGPAACYNTVGASVFIPFPVTMRASPTFATSGAFRLEGNVSIALTALALVNASLTAARIDASVAAGLTAGQAEMLAANTTFTAVLEFSAEI